MAENATMVSGAISPAPKDPKKFTVWLERILKDHQRDIDTLFSTCTDCDLFEKKQRDNNLV